jgi:hypothetical protein
MKAKLKDISAMKNEHLSTFMLRDLLLKIIPDTKVMLLSVVNSSNLVGITNSILE